MLSDIAQYLIDLSNQLGYPGLFVACFFENLFPPIPSELIMPFGGILAAKGQMSIIGAILVTSIWSVLGSIPYYFLGLRLHKRRVLDRTDRIGKYFFVNRESMEEVYRTFHKYGYSIVFWCRFIPIGRWFISLPAGSAGMPFWKFFVYSYLGTLIWSSLLVMIWYVYGNQQDLIHQFLDSYEKILIVGVGLICGVLIVHYLYRGQRSTRM